MSDSIRLTVLGVVTLVELTVPLRRAAGQVTSSSITSGIVATPALPDRFPKPGALRGRYRVTLTGFSVQNETADNPAGSDGKDDEVFVSTDVKILDRNGHGVIQGSDPTVTSYVFGEVTGPNSDRRQQAGTAGPLGGVRTGDHYPANPYVTNPLPGPRGLPLKLWEGDLLQGQNAVVVTPTIWEFDGSQDAEAFDQWVLWTRNAGQKLGTGTEIMEMAGAGGGAPTPLIPVTVNTAFTFTNHGPAQDGDRPIGVNRANRDIISFQPQSLALNYDNIESFLAPGHEVAGLPAGVYPLTYIDTGEWGGGNYTLYLKIERQ